MEFLFRKDLHPFPSDSLFAYDFAIVPLPLFSYDFIMVQDIEQSCTD